MEEWVVIEYRGKWYLIPTKFSESYEEEGRVDGCTYYTDGKEYWGYYWTNSNCLARCGCCGQYYSEFKSCGCTEDYFELSKEEFVEIAIELGEAREIPYNEAEALRIVNEIREIQKRVNELLSKVKDIEIKEVKEFGNGAHVTLPKNLIGRKVLIIPL